VLEQTVHTDLLVAADGSRSAVRAAFAPDTMTRYAGYIAWRGVVEEADLPEALVAFFDDSFSFCELVDGGHALCYFIPGKGGNEAAGKRRLNWVWYVTVPEGQSLDTLMTDSTGRRRDASVPAGLASAAAVDNFRERASVLEPHFAELLRATRTPFIQSIMDVVPPQMVYSRICLIGDAAFVVRPHTAAGTAKAAAEASALASALGHFAPDLDLALAHWDQTQTAAGRRLANYGVMLGERTRS
jgi:2-polyprenyl-6-methoxyphenol hydroxylase-like FAD-dependent oxidoreductase